jgi:LysM repeat protein
VQAAPTEKTAAPEQEEVVLLGASDIALTGPAPLTQTLAGMLKEPEPPVLPAIAAPAEAALSAASEIAIPRVAPQTKTPTITGIAAAAKQFRPFAERTIIGQVLKGKGGWLVGAVFLSASLLGLTLRFGVPGMKASGRPSIMSGSDSTGSLSREATSPTLTPLALGKNKGLPMDQHPAKELKVDADAVVHVVQTNETLSGISFDYLGHYDSTVLQEVQKNNSDLKDPDLIRVGQKVLLPTHIAASNGQNSSEKKASGSIEGKP